MPNFTSRLAHALSLAQRFGSVLSGVTPAVALAVAPLAPPQANQNAELARAMRFRIDRETTAAERSGIVSRAVNEWGLEVDEEQMRDEFNLDAVRPGSRPLPGKPQPVTSRRRCRRYRRCRAGRRDRTAQALYHIGSIGTGTVHGTQILRRSC
jgi:hypothetical protein